MLGSALAWSADCALDQRGRDGIEWALTALGALGAHLNNGGADAGAWDVTTQQATVHPNLTEVLSADPGHPLAATATAVLERIGYGNTAGSAVAIDHDGQFRAGPLRATPPTLLPAAQYVGAHARRAAALARAATLREEADDLRAVAAEHHIRARELRDRVRDVERRIGAAPSTGALVTAEGGRVEAAEVYASFLERARECRKQADELRERATMERQQWADRTIGAGLPASRGALEDLKVEGRERSAALRDAARPMPRLTARIADLTASTTASEQRRREVGALLREAREAHIQARTAAIHLDQARASIGIAAEEARREASRLEKAVRDRASELAGAGERATIAATQAGSATAKAEAAGTKLTQLEPGVGDAMANVRAALSVSGVAQAVLPGVDWRSLDDDALLAALSAATRDHPSTSSLVLRNARDYARAALQGVWQIDNSEAHGIETYVVTFDGQLFTPREAANLAAGQRQKAQQAVNEQEREALETFVLGTLPKAISIAWTNLRDWVKDVNKKMERTTASSGVGVQVRVDIKDHAALGEATWTVYQLACRKSVFERTDAESEALRTALDQLIRSDTGDTLEEQVLNAVDVRNWVSVHYVITRKDQEPTRWSSRMGVSGGEARLVTLAPMVAAVAAKYDELGPTAARVLVLDEVPAEVDAHGRGGLARYIAELDLDLVCTSFGWDGAPGATDGIDAYDLERASDGTVVETRSVLRGAELLDGDPDSWLS